MLAGHFGLAAIVKARRPQLPMWALMLSTQLLDVLFVGFVASGLESFTGGGYGGAAISAPYTHSLVSALVISLVAAIVTSIFWKGRNAIIIGSLVFSHWLLDLPLHKGDMLLFPGDTSGLRFGFGLWSITWLSVLLELALALVGAFLYYHAAMRSAIRAEREDQKAGTPPKGHRQQALITAVLMAVFLVGTLAADVLGLG